LIFAPRFEVFDEISWILFISVKKCSILLELVQRFRRKVKLESSRNEKKFIDEHNWCTRLQSLARFSGFLFSHNFLWAFWDCSWGFLASRIHNTFQVF
jgi:hypothetical protein